MKNRVPIGMGCYHFGLGKGFRDKFSWSAYSQAVKKAIESIPNASNIKIEGVEDPILPVSYTPPSDRKSVEDTVGCHPPFVGGTVTFDLFLPERLQEKYSVFGFWKSLFNTENFRISMYSTTSGLPVAFVELLKPSDVSVPSYAVATVREFLRESLPDTDDAVIRFECLGPSPVHTDLYFRLAESEFEDDEAEFFRVNAAPRRGYSLIAAVANPKYFESLDEAKEQFFFSLSAELGFYYSIVQRRNQLAHKWETIQDVLDDVIERVQTSGLRGIKEKTWNSPPLIDEVVTKIARFENSRIALLHSIQGTYRSVYETVEVPPVIQEIVDHEIQRLPDYPVGQTKTLLDFFEMRRSRTAETLVTILVGLLSAVVGSLLTIFVAR